MLYELPKSDYALVRPLFDGHRDHLVCISSFSDPDSRIFVDDLNAPSSALMVTWECWGFLAGNPHNQDFNRDLNIALWKRQAVGQDVWGLLLTAHPESWHAVLPDIVTPSHLVPFPRRHFTTDHIQFEWRGIVPSDYEIVPLDSALLSRYPGIEIPDETRKLLDVEIPREQGFGFVAIHQGTVAAHAMIDVIVGDEGEIGLYTHDNHRRRGLATITSAAAIEHGFELGLSLVRWDCNTDNAGSMRTAQKLGFQPAFDYMMHYFDF